MDKLLYRPKEAAQVLGIGPRFITANALHACVAMLQAEASEAA